MKALLQPTILIVLGFFASAIPHGADGQTVDTHPLMPGVRSVEINNPAWPRTLHDKQLTGFSPLVCGMRDAPRVWSTIPVGGAVSDVKKVRDRHQQELLIVDDGRLRLVASDGRVRWTHPTGGTVRYFGDLRGNGKDYLLLTAGRVLSLLDGETGQVEWQHRFEPAYASLRIDVGDVLPDQPGLEAAVFLHHGDQGSLVRFPPAGDPEFVWQRTVTIPGEHDERQDHGTDVLLDLSDPDQPIIWNVRHHRCRGLDASTGEILSSVVYEIGGIHRRNYGPWALGRGRDKQPLIAVISAAVQLHSHAVHVYRDRPNVRTWEHNYGYVFEKHGVRIVPVVIDDVDGDGQTELVYNVRDPERDYRAFVRLRDADTGEIEAELPDRWCVGASFHPSEKLPWVFLVEPDPERASSRSRELVAYQCRRPGHLNVIARFANAVTARSLILAPSGAFKRPETERKLVIRQTDADGILHLRRYAFRDGKAVLLNEGDADALVGATVRETLSMPDGRTALVLTGRDGTLGVWTWAGERLWDLPLAGGKRPTLSAADLDGDGRAELLTTTTADRLHVLSFDEHGQSERLFDHEFRGQSTFNRQSPLLYDLEGDGRLCLVTPVHTDDGRLAVRTLRADGSTLWETNLATSTSDGGRVVAWDAGECLPGPKPAIVVSVEKAGYTGEGSYCLDGVSGAIVWHKSLYGTGVSARPYRPRGIPTAFDVDGDGLEEIGFDMYSYMAWLRGRDGSFARIEHTRNLGAEDALYVGHLHHSFVPVFRHAADTKPHWFVPVGGYGPIGLMKPDPREGIWREETGADYPPKVGMIDVDGDGMMEVGYAVRGSTTFVCRDLWTGRVEWKLELPIALGDPVMTADVDGDGRGEFLAGRYCIGVNPAGEGTIRWTAPVSLDWAIIADFDGDGQGEIACPASGVVRILRAR